MYVVSVEEIKYPKIIDVVHEYQSLHRFRRRQLDQQVSDRHEDDVKVIQADSKHAIVGNSVKECDFLYVEYMWSSFTLHSHRLFKKQLKGSFTVKMHVTHEQMQ